MRNHAETTQHGQIIVFFAIAIVAIMAMVGLIIDGGNAYANQRATQNAADASAETGATVLAQSLLSVASGGAAKTDGQVLAAMNVSAADNNIRPFGPDDATHSVAYYTDVLGNMLTAAGTTTTSVTAAAWVGGETIPACTTNCIGGRATGVRALGRRDFNPVVAAAVGFSTFTAQSDATAVSGYTGPCDAAEGCALLPVTFATALTTCDGSGGALYAGFWAPATPPFTSSNEAILSLCKKGEGAFGWLDYGCGNMASQIQSPCNVSIPQPSWLLGQSGNPNNVESALNNYAGNVVGTYEPGLDQVVKIPFFDALCNEDRPDNEAPDPAVTTFPGACTNNPPGGGANRYYHEPFFIGFILDHAYVQGNNFPECNQDPGNPKPGGNGSGGCFKGWFARVLSAGPVTGTPPPGSNGAPLSVQLIK